jgi:UDP-N-acetylmuramyl pentapeptide synthase
MILHMVIVTFLALFWVPAGAAIITAFSWSLTFWQKQGFSLGFVAHHLRWDFSLTHRHRIRSGLKLIAFLLLSTVAISKSSPIPIIGILIAYAVWCADLFHFLENVLRRKPWDRWQPRTWIHLALVVILAAAIPVQISTGLFTYAQPSVQTYEGVLLSLARIDQNTLAALSGVYAYLVAATLFALFLDLASPILSFIPIALTSPVVRARNVWLIDKARHHLRQPTGQAGAHTELVKVAIIGSYGKSTIKYLLSEILHTDFHTAVPTSVTTEAQDLAEFVINQVHKDTHALITEITSFQPGDLQRTLEMLEPQIVVFTGIDRSSVGLWGDRLSIQQDFVSAIKALDRNTTLIINADDPLTHKLGRTWLGKQVWYSQTGDPAKYVEGVGKRIETTWTNNNDWKHTKTAISGELLVNGQGFDFELEHNYSDIWHSALAAISAASKLGVNPTTTLQRLVEFSPRYPNFEIYDGDNGSALIANSQTLSIARLRAGVNLARSTYPENRLVVITSGISRLGQGKHKIYADLSADIRLDKIHAVISNDKSLLKHLSRDNIHTALMYSDRVDDMIFRAHRLTDSNTTLLVLGDLDVNLVAELRKSE